MTTINEAAQTIICNVVRRLLRFQQDEYEAARIILDNVELSAESRTIVREELPVIAALYAIVYDQNDVLRVGNLDQRIGLNFIESKILQMKPNPHREQTAMLLRELFTDLRTERGPDFPVKKCIQEIIRALRKEPVVLEQTQQAA